MARFALIALMPAYVLFALQRVYRLSPGQALVATVVLGGGFAALLLGYRALLFFTTLYTL